MSWCCEEEEEEAALKYTEDGVRLAAEQGRGQAAFRHNGWRAVGYGFEDPDHGGSEGVFADNEGGGG
jgi:hypothetical protein